MGSDICYKHGQNVVRKQDGGHTGTNIKPASIRTLYFVPVCLQFGYWVGPYTGHFHQHIIEQGGVPSSAAGLHWDELTTKSNHHSRKCHERIEEVAYQLQLQPPTLSSLVLNKKHFCVFKRRCSFKIQSWTSILWCADGHIKNLVKQKGHINVFRPSTLNRVEGFIFFSLGYLQQEVETPGCPCTPNIWSHSLVQSSQPLLCPDTLHTVHKAPVLRP